MKQSNNIKMLSAAVLLAVAGYGCSDSEQQAADQSAEKAEVSTAPESSAAQRGAGGIEDDSSDKTMSPSLLSPSVDASSDISAIRAEDTSAEVQEGPDVDDETAVRNHVEQYHKTRDAETRAQIIDEVGSINPDDLNAVQLFNEALSDKNADVRIAAVNQLSTSEVHEAVDGLMIALHDSNTDVVLQAIDALTAKNDTRIPAELSALLTHKNEDIREAASSAIDSLQEE